MAIAETSLEARGQISMRERKQQVDIIFDVVVAACRNGAIDLSLREIAQLYAAAHGKLIDVGTVSGRVTELIVAQRLVRLPGAARPCSISGKTVAPVTVPAKQARMF